MEVIQTTMKEKIPRLDRWGVELFLHFQELMVLDILEAAEESRINRYIYGALNVMFITLIPKKHHLNILSNYRPISLCNAMYKIISKLIAMRIKNTLSTFISPEQFGFYEGKQIQGAIGIAKQFLHSLKVRKRRSSMIKVDLTKAYDCTDWEFLRMVLYKVGISTSNIG